MYNGSNGSKLPETFGGFPTNSSLQNGTAPTRDTPNTRHHPENVVTPTFSSLPPTNQWALWNNPELLSQTILKDVSTLSSNLYLLQQAAGSDGPLIQSSNPAVKRCASIILKRIQESIELISGKADFAPDESSKSPRIVGRKRKAGVRDGRLLRKKLRTICEAILVMTPFDLANSKNAVATNNNILDKLTQEIYEKAGISKGDAYSAALRKLDAEKEKSLKKKKNDGGYDQFNRLLTNLRNSSMLGHTSRKKTKRQDTILLEVLKANGITKLLNNFSILVSTLLKHSKIAKSEPCKKSSSPFLHVSVKQMPASGRGENAKDILVQVAISDNLSDLTFKILKDWIRKTCKSVLESAGVEFEDVDFYVAKNNELVDFSADDFETFFGAEQYSKICIKHLFSEAFYIAIENLFGSGNGIVVKAESSSEVNESSEAKESSISDVVEPSQSELNSKDIDDLTSFSITQLKKKFPGIKKSASEKKAAYIARILAYVNGQKSSSSVDPAP